MSAENWLFWCSLVAACAGMLGWYWGRDGARRQRAASRAALTSQLLEERELGRLIGRAEVLRQSASGVGGLTATMPSRRQSVVVATPRGQEGLN